MEIIDELELEKRGIAYAGAVGYFGADGSVDTCIVLRTGLLQGRRPCTSRPAAAWSPTATADAEYDETLHKARTPCGKRRAGGLAVRLVPLAARGQFLRSLVRHQAAARRRRSQDHRRRERHGGNGSEARRRRARPTGSRA